MAHISGNTVIIQPKGNVKLHSFGFAVEPKGHEVESLHNFVKTDIKALGLGVESKQYSLMIVDGPRHGKQVKLVCDGLELVNHSGSLCHPVPGNYVTGFYFSDGQRIDAKLLIAGATDVVCENYVYQLDGGVPFAFGIGYDPVFIYGQFPGKKK